MENLQPKIEIKTRHPSGDSTDKQNEATRVVESKRRSFIVSRVPEHNVIQEKIHENYIEEIPISDSTISPESTHQSTYGTSNVTATQSQQLSDEATYISDSERSVKSVGKGKIPLNISDLEESLTKLTRGNMGQLEVGSLPGPSHTPVIESHSPVPSDDGGVMQPSISQSQQQYSFDIQSKTEGGHPPPLPIQQQQHQASDIQQATGAHSSFSQQQQQPQQPTTQIQQPPQQTQMQAAVPSQTIPISQHQQGPPLSHVSSLSAQAPQSSSTTQQPIPQGTVPLSNTHSHSQDSGTSVPVGMYPPGMQYLQFVQHPMFLQPPNATGIMPTWYPPVEQLPYMNSQMVPYVVVNVQQQHGVSQMLLPANMLIPNQMGYMTTQTGGQMHHSQPPEPQVSMPSTESLVGSPPGTPPQSRKQNSVDTQSESGISVTDMQSPLPTRGNYSIANLEQELIKKLHGNRKDIPMASGPGQATSNESLSHAHVDPVPKTRADESLTPDREQDPLLSESSQVENKADLVAEKEEESQPAKSVTKKLRFSVSKVEDDPLRKVQVDDEDVKESSSSTSILKTDSTEPLTGSKVNMLKHGRFSVTKVNEEKDAVDSPLVDEVSEAATHKDPEMVLRAEKLDDKDVKIDENFQAGDLQTEDNVEGKLSEGVDNKHVGDGANYTASAELLDHDVSCVSSLLDLPYRKKSMSVIEGDNSPVKSNNTCHSFYNTHLDRFRIFNRRRTKSLGSLPLTYSYYDSSHSIATQSQCTQYGDGETPSPSPSPVEGQSFLSRVQFDLDSAYGETEDYETFSDSEIATGCVGSSDFLFGGKNQRRPLRRQARKVRL